jgi:hypothetical protein
MRPFQISDDDKYTSVGLCTLDMKKASRFRSSVPCINESILSVPAAVIWQHNQIENKHLVGWDCESLAMATSDMWDFSVLPILVTLRY